jgi:hypothetical protein
VADLRVELLAVEDCPHLEQARRDLESVLRKGIIEVPIQLIFVTGTEDAEFLGFQGSPTIRINGDDVVPTPELPIAFGCRMYRDADGRALGSPPIEAIRAAVDAHRRGRLEAFQREEAARVAEFAREADAAEAAGDADVAELPREADAAESSAESEGMPPKG